MGQLDGTPLSTPASEYGVYELQICHNTIEFHFYPTRRDFSADSRSCCIPLLWWYKIRTFHRADIGSILYSPPKKRNYAKDLPRGCLLLCVVSVYKEFHYNTIRYKYSKLLQGSSIK